MKIQELHQNEAARQEAFPVCKESTFLAHAGVCPIPQAVVTAMTDYTNRCVTGDQETVFPSGKLIETRRLAAQTLHCDMEEIALIGPTSIGLSLVANGIDWSPGDNVVFYAEDYPSNAVPWMALEQFGVEAREVKPQHLGAVTVADLERLVDSRTRLVALASAHFISGHRLDVNAIGAFVHSHRALFCVDGIQTIGALNTPLAHVDFMAADAHKWLLGPCAAGIFYARREAQAHLRPTLLGWNNVLCPGYVTPRQVEFPKHAGRYEAGSPNLIGILGLHACFSMIQELGSKEIEATVLSHTRFLRSELRKKGYVLAGKSDDSISGITSFHPTQGDIHGLHQQLMKARIVSSLRQTRDGQHWIRLSPHFYNTRTELETVLNHL